VEDALGMSLLFISILFNIEITIHHQHHHHHHHYHHHHHRHYYYYYYYYDDDDGKFQLQIFSARSKQRVKPNGVNLGP